MKVIQQSFLQYIKWFFFWIFLFNLQRLLFSIHNWGKLEGIAFGEWTGVFFHSFRLDCAAAAFLSLVPLLFYSIYLATRKNWSSFLFKTFLWIEIAMVIMIHAGEINAYTEWNHKLTSRVFMHLMNPDEVFRTADYAMTIWFFIYTIIEFILAFLLLRLLIKLKNLEGFKHRIANGALGFLFFAFNGPLLILIARGGLQPIPINIDAAYFSKNYVVNDISVNSFYFFGKSYLVYNRSDIDKYIPHIDSNLIDQELKEFYTYPLEHENHILTHNRPNIVFLILESWTAKAIGSLNPLQKPSATPQFDKLTQEGLLFTQLYATGGTSEIGNSSIFSGYPALPEISISMQPEKHRQLPSFNEDLKKWGYTSHYLFSGDLKYGNIGSYFQDHGFDAVLDEDDFPKGLQRGKLNFYDEDLYDFFIEKMNQTKEPFMHCAFSGSTHSPYDYPNPRKKFKGAESAFMNSMLYADESLAEFFQKAKQQKWYKNTLFVIVADHGHASEQLENPNLGGYFHVPLLIIGEPLKKEFKGKKIDHLGSQADIVRTLLYQMGGNYQRYVYAKDLLNPNAPQFALHTINRGYGWISTLGNFSYHMDGKIYPDQTMKASDLKKEERKCKAYMSRIYQDYKKL